MKSMQNTRAKEIATATSALQEVKEIVKHNAINNLPSPNTFNSFYIWMNLIENYAKTRMNTRWDWKSRFVFYELIKIY